MVVYCIFPFYGCLLNIFPSYGFVLFNFLSPVYLLLNSLTILSKCDTECCLKIMIAYGLADLLSIKKAKQQHDSHLNSASSVFIRTQCAPKRSAAEQKGELSAHSLALATDVLCL